MAENSNRGTEFLLTGFPGWPELQSVLFGMLVSLWSGRVSITSRRCVVQFFLFTLCSCIKCFLLTVMTYDCYMSSHHLDFFFCDLPPLLKLSCTTTKARELVIYFVSLSIIMTSIMVILVSYLFIIKAILCICLAGGRAKTFSTCGSHMTTVALFFGTIAFMYLKGNMGQALEVDKVVSVFYTVLIPMLNPMIYSPRNKEVKKALRKILHRSKFTQGP
ncbi:olfactory receptor 9Q2-like [Tachyglossus aculeatus]|uniref:olfactory receptor 9Q2-like n=1 Tax=Tachyglossus aculeatus TaxID=9261 RepID=UPI0018F4679B|nr:olfactory receptor 9Q2-like [Tachyglossus aculeatus]